MICQTPLCTLPLTSASALEQAQFSFDPVLPKKKKITVLQTRYLRANPHDVPIRNEDIALAGEARFTGHRPVHRKAPGSIPGWTQARVVGSVPVGATQEAAN